MNKVKLLFFATLKDLAGTRHSELDLEPGMDVATLKSRLPEHFPKLQPAMSSVLVSINREFAFDQDEIPEGAEIAFFPPVSGG
ncbi:MAG: MoaD/ThiS family protein [Anaerolineae bacterium]|nr:MoaD/ThiS family protein [Anaerolineae bacterium]